MGKRSKKHIAEAAVAQHERAVTSKLSISFKYLDLKDELFFLEGMENGWYESLFRALQTLKELNYDQFTRGGDSLTVKPIGWGKSAMSRGCFPTPVGLSEQQMADYKAMTERCYEFYVTKNRGRIHGFLFSNIFYVVWFDPAHNLIPGKMELRTADMYRSVRSCSIDEINGLTEEREKLLLKLENANVEIASLYDILEKQTK